MPKTREVSIADLCRGPGNVCKAMVIDRAFSGCDMQQRGSLLYVAQSEPISNDRVRTSPRIGVGGDEIAKTVEWRYTIAGHPGVSGQRMFNSTHR
jgi:3-methyladenine DNA glycosylase Mpg